MKDRLKQFLDENHLSAKEFAEKIEVQASSISHIISGRNKPSLEFLEKMLRAYPEIDLKYMITGEKSSTPSNDPIDVPNEHVKGAVRKGNRVIVLNEDGTFDEYEKI